jgi:ParB family chromosome partitioning protein
MPRSATIQQLDPRMLIVDVDVRAEAWPDRDFVSSIRDSPVKGLHTSDGRIRVRYGHGRVLAAIEAGRETVPVLVHEAEDDLAGGPMVHLSDEQDGTTPAPRDQIASVAYLTSLGMSAAQIARRTQLARADVDAAILASSSDLAVQAVQRYEFLTVAQAAAVAEFDDNKLAVSVLIIAAQRTPAQFDEVVMGQYRRRARLERVRANRARVDRAKIAHPARDAIVPDTNRAGHGESHMRTFKVSRPIMTNH